MSETSENMIIAIDGFSSCGKSTFAKSIAKKYGLLYIDSGAMYRGVTLWAIENDAIEGDDLQEEKIVEALDSISIEFKKESNEQYPSLWLNGVNVEEKIRSMEVSNHVSPVSKIAAVREKMVELQREMSENSSVVMDGRDIGTVVFPNADIKVFMTALPEIRARRRYDEMLEKGREADLKTILENVNKRDQIDQNRDVSPLKQAEDAEVLDNSHLSPEEQMIWFAERFKTELL